MKNTYIILAVFMSLALSFAGGAEEAATSETYSPSSAPAGSSDAVSASSAATGADYSSSASTAADTVSKTDSGPSSETAPIAKEETKDYQKEPQKIEQQNTTPSLYITTQSIPEVTIGQHYSATIRASGGVPVYSWSIISGSLPRGIHMSQGASIANIGGVPTESGGFNFTIQVEDEVGNTAQKTFSLLVLQNFTISCAIIPSSLDVQVNTLHRLEVACRGSALLADPERIGVPCPPLSWNSTIGSVFANGSVGHFANYSSGPSAGNGTITASGPGVSCTIPVKVNGEASASSGGSGSGGSGGSYSGGSSYRTATTIRSGCAGKPMEMAVKYLGNFSGSATVDVYYLSAQGFSKVFSNTISSTSNLSFTPENSGSYQLRVSLGTDQTTADFTVPACTPETVNTTQNITVNLASNRELLLHKNMSYSGGFSKQFRIYKTVTPSGGVDYETEVDIYYSNTADAAQKMSIQDLIPSSVVSNMSMVSFQVYPQRLSADSAIAFEWAGLTSEPGSQLHFSYSFPRQMTAQMIDGLPAPKAIYERETKTITATQLSQGGENSMVAALFGFFGNGFLFLALFLIIALLVLIYLFVFDYKKKE